MIAKWVSAPRTFAELHARLGGVPLERILTTPPPGAATESDLERYPGPTCELIDGVLVEKAMGSLGAMLGLSLASQLLSHVKSHDLGIVLGGDRFIRLGPGLVRAPDATFIPWASFPDEGLPDEAFWTVAPGLVVEVLSPGNTPAEIDRKLSELFAGGCKLAWVIDPRAKSARVHTSADKFKVLDETGTLDGGTVLPGFKLSLADLFAVGQRRKNRPR